ncbi:hypothetical protein E4U21_003919 [Claviceps maximensis]|nr:hypothetical protein E4U21_003919 [Claviceps maximensis]
MRQSDLIVGICSGMPHALPGLSSHVPGARRNDVADPLARPPTFQVVILSAYRAPVQLQLQLEQQEQEQQQQQQQQQHCPSPSKISIVIRRRPTSPFKTTTITTPPRSQFVGRLPTRTASWTCPLTQAEQRTLEQRMQKRQVKEFMSAFGGLVEHCFTSCVDDFTSKAISTRENGCINRCVLKWMATQQRVSDRFQEHNAQLTQQMQNK